MSAIDEGPDHDEAEPSFGDVPATPRLETVRVAGPVHAIGAPSPKGVALGPAPAPWGVRPSRVVGAMVLVAATVIAALNVARSGASDVDTSPGPSVVVPSPSTRPAPPTAATSLPIELPAPTTTFDRISMLLEAGRRASTTVAPTAGGTTASPAVVAAAPAAPEPPPVAPPPATAPPTTVPPTTAPPTTVPPTTAPPATVPPTTARPATTAPPTTAAPRPAVTTRPRVVTIAPTTRPATTVPPTTRDERGRGRRGRDDDDD